MKLISWNVNGLLAATKSSALPSYVVKEQPNVLALQGKFEGRRWGGGRGEAVPALQVDSFWYSKETRLGDAKAKELEGKILDPDVYQFEYHSCSKGRQGYSGTAVYSKIKPRAGNYGIGLPEFDHEGRAVTLEFDSFFLVSTYVPNAGEGQKRYKQHSF